MKNLVSVIITTYNHVAYIRGCINSVLEQTYRDLEIVVVDDGSTDESREVLEKYIKTGKIHYFYQDNRGLSAARNKGLELASGSYVKFLDSDDWLYPLQIEKQMDDLLIANDDLAMSMTNFSMMGPSGKIVDIDVPMVKKKLQLGHFYESNRGGIHTYIFPKGMVEKAKGFDESLKACEDLDLKLRLIMRGAYVRKIDYIGCCYRLVNTGMSNDTLHMFLEKCKVYEKASQSLFNDRVEFPWYLTDRILSKNSMLIDECLARRLDLDRVLKHTIHLTDSLCQATKKGAINMIYNLLGFKNYFLLRYYSRIGKDKQYKRWLLTQEISWKIQ